MLYDKIIEMYFFINDVRFTSLLSNTQYINTLSIQEICILHALLDMRQSRRTEPSPAISLLSKLCALKIKKHEAFKNVPVHLQELRVEAARQQILVDHNIWINVCNYNKDINTTTLSTPLITYGKLAADVHPQDEIDKIKAGTPDHVFLWDAAIHPYALKNQSLITAGFKNQDNLHILDVSGMRTVTYGAWTFAVEDTNCAYLQNGYLRLSDPLEIFNMLTCTQRLHNLQDQKELKRVMNILLPTNTQVKCLSDYMRINNILSDKASIYKDSIIFIYGEEALKNINVAVSLGYDLNTAVASTILFDSDSKLDNISFDF